MAGIKPTVSMRALTQRLVCRFATVPRVVVCRDAAAIGQRKAEPNQEQWHRQSHRRPPGVQFSGYYHARRHQFGASERNASAPAGTRSALAVPAHAAIAVGVPVAGKHRATVLIGRGRVAAGVRGAMVAFRGARVRRAAVAVSAGCRGTARSVRSAVVSGVAGLGCAMSVCAAHRASRARTRGTCRLAVGAAFVGANGPVAAIGVGEASEHAAPEVPRVTVGASVAVARRAAGGTAKFANAGETPGVMKLVSLRVPCPAV